jgi:hypothetical protein
VLNKPFVYNFLDYKQVSDKVLQSIVQTWNENRTLECIEAVFMLKLMWCVMFKNIDITLKRKLKNKQSCRKK